MSVLLADGDALAAAQITQLLAPAQGIRIAGAARTLDELRLLVEEERPDAIVMEMSLRGESVLAALPGLCAAAPVLILSADESETAVLGAIAAGVSGYLLKEHAFGRFVDVLQACAQGGTVLDEQLSATLFAGYRDLAGGRPRLAEASLSGRALSVLELMASGLRNREIADRLGLSEHTVKVYVGQVLAYLGVPDRTSAVMQGIRRGLVRPPGRDVKPMTR